MIRRQQRQVLHDNDTCVPSCVPSTRTDCSAKRFGCRRANTRRFQYLFGTFTPAGAYFRDFVSLAAQKQVRACEIVCLSR